MNLELILKVKEAECLIIRPWELIKTHNQTMTIRSKEEKKEEKRKMRSECLATWLWEIYLMHGLALEHVSMNFVSSGSHGLAMEMSLMYGLVVRGTKRERY